MDKNAPHKKELVAAPSADERELCLERQNIAFDAIFGLLDRLGTTQDVKKIVQLFLMTIMGR